MQRLLPSVSSPHLFAINDSIAALEGALLGVSVHALQEGTTAAKGQVLRTPAMLLHVFQNGPQSLVANAVTLDDAQVVWQHPVALAVLAGAKLLAQDVQHLTVATQQGEKGAQGDSTSGVNKTVHRGETEKSPQTLSTFLIYSRSTHPVGSLDLPQIKI